uniref:Uncharacterized protein n=1 Tax=Dulem virus 234 TaxID=3145711 RepID=A0AAU8B812_9VIRU
MDEFYVTKVLHGRILYNQKRYMDEFYITKMLHGRILYNNVVICTSV